MQPPSVAGRAPREFAVRARTVERVPRDLTGCSVRGRLSLAVKWTLCEFTARCEMGTVRVYRAVEMGYGRGLHP